MKWKVAFVLLLTTEVVFAAPPFVQETLENLRALGSCFVRCYTEFTWKDVLCVEVDGTKFSVANKTYNCVRAKCIGGEFMEYLYMGWCGKPIPSTGHIFTEPKIPSPYKKIEV